MKKIILLFVILAIALSTGTVYANTYMGGTDALVFYARIEGEVIYHTDDWAAIIFYRMPECVPTDFNLLDFFDFSAPERCPLPTVDGFTLWSGDAWFSNPLQFRLTGLGAVPVWFIQWPVLEAAIADGQLTMTELAGLPSLQKGYASTYSEMLQPFVGYPEARPSKINFTARGKLEDGRGFFVHALVITDGIANTQITID